MEPNKYSQKTSCHFLTSLTYGQISIYIYIYVCVVSIDIRDYYTYIMGYYFYRTGYWDTGNYWDTISIELL